MPFKFITQPLLSGLYEPEGLYLNSPCEGESRVLQFWGENPEFYGQFTYNGVPLKGHNGLDLAVRPGSQISAVDGGRVTEISVERGGYGLYLKVEHSWGESFYAHLGEVTVEAGHWVARGVPLALASEGERGSIPHLHLSIRLKPFHRFDGWGGFTDPLPYLPASDIQLPAPEESDELPIFLPPPVAVEKPGLRRA